MWVVGILGSYFPEIILNVLWMSIIQEKSIKLLESDAINNTFDAYLIYLRNEINTELLILDYLLLSSNSITVSFFYKQVQHLETLLNQSTDKYSLNSFIFGLLVILTCCKKSLFIEVFNMYLIDNINVAHSFKVFLNPNIEIPHLLSWLSNLITNASLECNLNQFCLLLDVLENITIIFSNAKTISNTLKNNILTNLQDKYLNQSTFPSSLLIDNIMHNPYPLITMLFDDINTSVSVYKGINNIQADKIWILDILSFIGCTSDSLTSSNILYYLLTCHSSSSSAQLDFVYNFTSLCEQYLLNHPNCLNNLMSKILEKLQNCTSGERTLIIEKLLLVCNNHSISNQLGKAIGKHGKSLLILLLNHQESCISRLLCHIKLDPSASTSIENRVSIQQLSALAVEYLIASVVINSKNSSSDKVITIDVLYPLLITLSSWNSSCCSIMLDVILDFIFSNTSSDILSLPNNSNSKQLIKLPAANTMLSTNYMFHPDVNLFISSKIINDNNYLTSHTHSMKYDSLLFKNKKRSIEKSSNGSFTIIRDEDNSNKKAKIPDSIDNLEPESTIFYMDKVLASHYYPYLASQHNICNIINVITGKSISSSMQVISEQQLIYLPILTQQFLIRTLDSLNPVPTYEQYQEVLPKRSSFPRDEYVWKLFSQSTILFHIMNIIAIEPREFCKCIELVKSLLANLIGYWNIEANTPSSVSVTISNNFLFTHTMLVLNSLNISKWLPSPLSFAPELIKYLSPKDICNLLLAIWNFLREFPPLPSQFQYDSTTGTFSRSIGEMQNNEIELHLHPIKQLLSSNIDKLSYFYVRFVNKT